MRLSKEEVCANQTAHVVAEVLNALRTGQLVDMLQSPNVVLDIQPEGADGRIVCVTLTALRIDTTEIGELPKQYQVTTTVAVHTEASRT